MESRACNVKVRAETWTPGTPEGGGWGLTAEVADTRVLWSPERRGGALGGGCGRDTACGGEETLMAGPPRRWFWGPLPRPVPGGDRLFGESVSMGTERFGKGEMKGGKGLGDAKSEPPLPRLPLP